MDSAKRAPRDWTLWFDSEAEDGGIWTDKPSDYEVGPHVELVYVLEATPEVLRAVNSHAALVEALEDAGHWLGQAWACIEHIKETAPRYEKKAAIEVLKEIGRAAKSVQNALAKATEGGANDVD